MNRFSVTLAAATASALALIIGSPVGARACSDAKWRDLTIANQKASLAASIQGNLPGSLTDERFDANSEAYRLARVAHDTWRACYIEREEGNKD
jgi:hypothetical protein